MIYALKTMFLPLLWRYIHTGIFGRLFFFLFSHIAFTIQSVCYIFHFQYSWLQITRLSTVYNTPYANCIPIIFVWFYKLYPPFFSLRKETCSSQLLLYYTEVHKDRGKKANAG